MNQGGAKAYGSGTLSIMAEGKREPYRPMTLVDLSLALSGAVDEAGRQRWVQEFLEEYRWEPRATKAALISEEPPSSGDTRYDALIGALAEHFAYHDGLPMPAWAKEPGRFLEQWWFPVACHR